MLHLQYLLAQAMTMGLVLFNDGDPHDEKLELLGDRLLDLNEQSQSIQALADAEKRDLTDEESTQLDALANEFEHVESEITRRKRINDQTAKLQQSMGRQSEAQNPQPQNKPSSGQPQSVDGKSRTAGSVQLIERVEDRGRWGWRNIGEFACAVRQSSGLGSSMDPRLIQNAPTSFGSEGANADGGFAVPPDFREAIMGKVMAEDSLISRTDQMVSSSNKITLPKDETTPWAGGVAAAWTAEAAQLAQSKPALLEQTVALFKLTALVPMTEELLDDAPATDSYLRRKVPEKFDFKISDAIVNGTGSGQPEGILTSGALVTVAKEAAQAADTVLFDNIINMWSRMYGPSRRNAVWLINQDIEPQLLKMSFEGTSSSVPAYMPANGLAGSPFGTLMGRPVVPAQACQTLGDAGDIILADLTQYMTVTKTGGLRGDVSMHLFFDYDMAAFRFIMRVGGQSWFDAAITPANSSATLSPFVALAARA